ncbi:hypothetical protein Gotur_014726 [Gossypium turneri]
MNFVVMGKNGTRSLKYHIGLCKKNPSNIVDTRKWQLVLPNKGVEEGEGCLSTWRFDQEACRIGLAQMIMIDELPFKFFFKVNALGNLCSWHVLCFIFLHKLL